jgi:signal transduction histidine kinase
MSGKSLRLRLLLAAAISIAVALGIAGLGLVLLFERYVERRVEEELKSHLLQLAAAIKVSDGRIVVSRELADPRFSRPLSGLYWQIDADGTHVARSRSLWDEQLEVPTPPTGPEEVHIHLLHGPEGSELFSQERVAIVTIDGKDKPLVLTAGLDKKEIEETVSAFRRDLILSLSLLGAVLVLAAWAQVTVGLKPLKVLRARLERVRAGVKPRLEGDFPSEVQPLADEVNGLLTAQEQQLERARRRAGDLAHGLKTPITILATIARELRRTGSQRMADDIEEQIGALSTHVERELARTRIATGRGNVMVPLKPTLERVLKVIKQLPEAGRLTWDCSCDAKTLIAMDSVDLTELLGNLLDNARKWASKCVAITCEAQENASVLRIDDDGPGVPSDKLIEISQPGRRLDEARQGSGLGLAIVADLAEAYGFQVKYGPSPIGGLQVSVSFPHSRGQTSRKVHGLAEIAS